MIELGDVCIRVGKLSLSNLCFRVNEGEYAVLMGRTGQGKTTILEAICGLKRLSCGWIKIRSHDVTDWLPGDRGVGYVPQDLSLFPTRTVRENLGFALRLLKHPRQQIRRRTDEVADMLGITPLLDRHVDGLSGGEAQRVALGRAISFEPTVLLLDEPLSSLDESTRLEMQQLLQEIVRQRKITTLHVTHRREEAIALADRRFLLSDGRVTES